MSLKKVHDNQPKEFYFNEANLKIADEILKKYPEKIKRVQLCLYCILHKNKMITGYH